VDGIEETEWTVRPRKAVLAVHENEDELEGPWPASLELRCIELSPAVECSGELDTSDEAFLRRRNHHRHLVNRISLIESLILSASMSLLVDAAIVVRYLVLSSLICIYSSVQPVCVIEIL
jgi:hypothetical protein